MKSSLQCISLLLIVNVCNASFVGHKEKPVAEQTSINQNFYFDIQATNPLQELSVDVNQHEKDLKEKVTKKMVQDYESITGKKMNFFDRLTFKLVKNRIAKRLGMAENRREGFNLGGFLLGLFLPLIGVLGAYIFSKDRNFIQWAWIGTCTYLLVALIFFLVLLGKMT
jgi:hypothetical protein